MKYRKFGSTEWQSSILALGMAKISSMERQESIRIIRHAIDLGINYLDLGYPFDLRRQEHLEQAVCAALQNSYREKIRFAVTLPTHLIHSRSHFEYHLRSQLNWLGAETASFCLIGRINRQNWPVLLNHGVVDWAEAAIESGLANHVGFSFHDHFQVLRTVIAGWDRWSLCQFQFSCMDLDHDPGVGGIRYAAEQGLAVVVAEPLRGGRLAGEVPKKCAELWATAPKPWSRAEWGLRFVWNYPEVACAIRDLSLNDDLVESAAIADRVEPDGLTVEEELFLSQIRDRLRASQQILCTSCRACMPCPEQIDVPRIFEIFNDVFIYGDVETARGVYRRELHQAERCDGCGYCETHCIKKLPVMDWLGKARQLLD